MPYRKKKEAQKKSKTEEKRAFSSTRDPLENLSNALNDLDELILQMRNEEFDVPALIKLRGVLIRALYWSERSIYKLRAKS